MAKMKKIKGMKKGKAKGFQPHGRKHSKAITEYQ